MIIDAIDNLINIYKTETFRTDACPLCLEVYKIKGTCKNCIWTLIEGTPCKYAYTNVEFINKSKGKFEDHIIRLQKWKSILLEALEVQFSRED